MDVILVSDLIWYAIAIRLNVLICYTFVWTVLVKLSIINTQPKQALHSECMVIVVLPVSDGYLFVGFMLAPEATYAIN